MIQWHQNRKFFQKITKNRPAARGFPPDPYSLRQLGLRPRTHVCHMFEVSIRLQNYTFGRSLSPLSIAKSWLCAKHTSHGF